ncbi:unnamed protein product [Owenia fusiformis]|uniref:Apple domain-containing protein n=1 Tax=Owenia fusiformis TaxID=6347 RepID=A0A8S4PDS2_OWEFU|nr:unnamed protein product [Owenia fusiformis]
MLSATSPTTCAFMCKENEDCLSAHFSDDSSICRLYNRYLDTVVNSTNTYNETGSVYIEIPMSDRNLTCGRIMREAKITINLSTNDTIPDGWRLCYIDGRDTNYYFSDCRDLFDGFPGIGGNGGANELLDAGGNFGCWRGVTPEWGMEPAHGHWQDAIPDCCSAGSQHYNSMVPSFTCNPWQCNYYAVCVRLP